MECLLLVHIHLVVFSQLLKEVLFLVITLFNWYLWKFKKYLHKLIFFLFFFLRVPGWNTGVGSCSLLQRIFLTQGSNPGLPHCRWILYQLSHQGSPLFYKCWQMHRIVSLWLPQSGLCSLTYPHPLVLSLGSQTFPPPF